MNPGKKGVESAAKMEDIDKRRERCRFLLCTTSLSPVEVMTGSCRLPSDPGWVIADDGTSSKEKYVGSTMAW